LGLQIVEKQTISQAQGDNLLFISSLFLKIKKLRQMVYKGKQSKQKRETLQFINSSMKIQKISRTRLTWKNKFEPIALKHGVALI
jgi:hypothetical protein